jgi:hypothetical protein
VKSQKKNGINSSRFFEECDLCAGFCKMPINIKRTKMTYILSAVISSHFLIPEQNEKELTLFKIFCQAVGFIYNELHNSYIKNVSNALTKSSSDVLNWGPYTSQNVSHEAGNEPILPHRPTENPSKSYIYIFILFNTPVFTLSLIMWVSGVTNCV